MTPPMVTDLLTVVEDGVGGSEEDGELEAEMIVARHVS